MFVFGNLLYGVAAILGSVLTIYFWILLARVVISWVNADPYNPIVRFLCAATDPALYWVRRWLPFSSSIGMIDLTPLILALLLQLLQYVLVRSLYQLAFQLSGSPQ